MSVFLYRVINLCFYPYPLENGEGICAHMTQLLKMGDLYKDMDSFPLIVANYPPVYFLLCGLFDFSNIFLIGRLVSVFSVLSIALILYIFIKKCCKDGLSALFAVSVLFILPWVSVAGILYRVDMLASCLSFAGFCVLVGNGRRRYFWSTMLFLLALYTKHSVLVGPIAGYGYLFSCRMNGFQVLKKFLVFLLFGGVIFVLITLLTDGGFYNHLIRYNVYDFSFDRFLLYFGIFVRKIGILWLLFLLLIFPKNRVMAFCKSPIGIYFFIGLISLLLTAREGASDHYLYEAGIGSAMAFGFIVSDRKDNTAYLFIVVAIIQIFFNKGLFKSVNISKHRYIVDGAVVKKIKSIKAPVLSEDVGMVLVAGKTVYVHTFAISKLIERGVLDPTFLYKHLQRGFFEQVILNSTFNKMKQSTRERFTKEMLVFIYRKYFFDKQFGSQYFYRYKDRINY